MDKFVYLWNVMIISTCRMKQVFNCYNFASVLLLFLTMRTNLRSNLLLRSYLMKWVYHLHHNRLGGDFRGIQYIICFYFNDNESNSYIDVRIERIGKLTSVKLQKSFQDVGMLVISQTHMDFDEEGINVWLV